MAVTEQDTGGGAKQAMEMASASARKCNERSAVTFRFPLL